MTRYEVFIGLFGTILLTRAIWYMLTIYHTGVYLVILLGVLLLMMKPKILKRLPDFKAFSKTVQNRALSSISALLIGYGVWMFLNPFMYKYKYWILGIGLFLIIFQQSLGEVFNHG